MAGISNTRAKVRLSPPQIEQILDLPDGYRVLYVGSDFDPASITVIVHSDHLDEVPPDCELPILHGSLVRDQVIVNHKVYSRWSWSPLDAEMRKVDVR